MSAASGEECESMCGIAGIIFRERNDALRERFREKARIHLVRRGPDAFASKCLNLGDVFAELHHARLSIIDLEGGAQPMSDSRGTIVFNGEIYNFRDLAEPSTNYRTSSDTEVLLNGLGRQGLRFLQQARGMFAFAWIDEQDRKLHLARDAYGIKPLYYIEKHGTFAFASTLPALMILSEGQIDQQALAQFYTARAPRGERTIFDDIKEVRPGECCTLDLETWTLEKRQWMPRPTPSRSNANDNDLADELESILDQSVRMHLVSDVPVATLLSGGIDSSLITALAARHNPGIAAFTMGFTDPKYDETPYAAALARKYGIKHHVFYCKDEDFIERLKDWPMVVDDAVANPSTVLLHAVSQFARDCGYKVLLAGEGADEFFGGYHQQWRYAMAAKAHPAFKPFAFATNWLEQLVPHKTRLVHNAHILAKTSAFHGTSTIFEPHLAAQIFSFQVDEPPAASNIRDGLEIDRRYRLPDDMLTATDRATMHASVEARVPFITQEVANFAASLHEDKLISLFQQKKILRTVARRHIPAQCIDRRKAGFDLPLSRWFRTNLKESLLDALKTTWQRDYFHPGALEKIVDWHMSGKANLPDKLWAFWFLEQNVRALRAVR